MYTATQPARSIESVAPTIPPDLAAVVNRALAFERDHRWPSARAMRIALRNEAAGTPRNVRAVLEIDTSAATFIQGSNDEPLSE
jgi:serine/threonine-protein kinase